ncbi:MAG TPA: transcription elongation factor GreAB [Elusimicrobia bacterium]|nr:transcription elongation factor GreAB [Elusimicrobiota bacterium]
MSRAFVKEDSNAPEEPRKRHPSGRPNYVTPGGRAWLEGRVEKLAAQRSALLGEKRMDEPRALRLSQTELDLAYYEAQLKRSILVDNRGLSASDVRFGAAVSVKEEDGTVREFYIVGEDEADADAGRLNWASPLAGALLGAVPGKKVSVPRKSGDIRLEVVSVRYPKH